MIDVPRDVVSLGEAMYQSAFLSLEFRLNSEVATRVKIVRDPRKCSVNYV